jgi:hypothetical protein
MESSADVGIEQVFKDMGGGTEWYYSEMEQEDSIRDGRRDCLAWVEAGGLAAQT